MESPPKRVTRARAAKVAQPAASRTKKIVTAAAKAKTARSTAAASAATTSSTSTSTSSSLNTVTARGSVKRKSPFDDDDEDSDHDDEQSRSQSSSSSIAMKAPTRGRGRPKKAADVAPAGPAASIRTRGRPKKATESTTTTTQEPVTRTTRTARRKKATDTEVEPTTDAAPARKTATATTRTRPAMSATASTAAKSLAKPAVKKSVKFEEPEKENVVPAPAPTTTRASTTPKTTVVAGGLRGKPVRSKAAPATGRTTTSTSTSTSRTTRGATVSSNEVSKQSTKEAKPLPLSPKKINQLALKNRAAVVESDDELGMDEKKPVRRFKKAPVKAAVVGATKALASSLDRKCAPTENDENTIPTVSITADQPTLTLMLGTPAKRLPASPWKGTIKSPPRRIEGLVSVSHSHEDGGNAAAQSSPTKMGLLQTPAKRQPLSIPISFGSVSAAGNGGGALPMASPFKFSLLSSPAKRSMMISPVKSMPPRIEEEEEPRSPAPTATLLAGPMPAAADEDMVMTLEGESEDEDENMPDSPSRPRFTGRLSAIVPREADPAMSMNMLALPEDNDVDDIKEEQEQAEEALEGEADEQIQEEAAADGNEAEAQEDDDSAETIIQEEDEEEAAEDQGEPMALDEVEAPIEEEEEEEEEEEDEKKKASTTPSTSPKAAATPAMFHFGLREKDLKPYHDEDTDSEEETPARHIPVSSAAFSALPATPSVMTPTTQISRATRSSGRSTVKKARVDSGLGFTPLAAQLGNWVAGPSPLKTGISAPSPVVARTANVNQQIVEEDLPTPGMVEPANDFFENAMAVSQPEAEAMDIVVEAAEPSPLATPDSSAEIETPILEDVSFTAEDAALAAEADGMSLLEPEQVEELVNTSNSSHDDTVSEASQEYGDENELPVAPAPAPVTPGRVLRRREVHTVAKVPLKAADDSTPLSRPTMQTRSSSASKVSVSRPTQGMSRNATVISYTPTKGGDDEQDLEATEQQEQEEKSEVPSQLPPVTPNKTDIWSTMGTPARTPRRDLNPALLRGAVVFVDVHTSEGADASGVFVELLNQMGARCLKEWKWNPDGEAASKKVGITHVVYKDGGKRTLEKVRETKGVVQCVGVSWVLDCERENQWLEEAPYYIDTSMVPRGGARRRKSMEPKAMTNMNGTLIPTPVNNKTSSGSASTSSAPSSSSGSSRRASSAAQSPTTPVNKNKSSRRASSLWVRTPEAADSSADLDDEDGENKSPIKKDKGKENGDDTDWGVVLTPVPKTPAPEAIARYAANISPGFDDEDTIDEEEEEQEDTEEEREAKRQAMLTRTCPPKRTTFAELGAGLLAREKDERVLMRLMAARRKSLQFAPKIGSPLARSWR
ncbi:hypothetical protein QBC35DRAFT_485972 [Podospora australis]|uniref:BRCT domain-containing protein n=1 Tax=Podospora australis TaxID=1536484 RepID=A0AAN6X2P4_9PEZI|nr:hypothetical protein QBC35DRAFT_485972 [Podospora australis]